MDDMSQKSKFTEIHIKMSSNSSSVSFETNHQTFGIDCFAFENFHNNANFQCSASKKTIDGKSFESMVGEESIVDGRNSSQESISDHFTTTTTTNKKTVKNISSSFSSSFCSKKRRLDEETISISYNFNPSQLVSFKRRRLGEQEGEEEISKTNIFDFERQQKNQTPLSSFVCNSSLEEYIKKSFDQNE